MDKAAHLSNDDLILFLDRELDLAEATAAERHLFVCAECSKRLAALRAGSAAYGAYHEEVLKPALAVPASDWGPIRERVEERNKPFAWKFWWAGAALACGLAALVFYFQRPEPLGAPQLLAKAEAAPESAPQALVFTSSGATLRRPALQHVQALFIQANYSWERPLSARSFAAWRRQLSAKEDLVTSIREGSGPRYYRVRTHTAAGILHTASITLQADNYRATQATFEFQGENSLEVAERLVDVPPTPEMEPPAARPKVTETVAGPEDELRVFAALNAMGADADEPVDVKLDAGGHHVVVTGMGMPAARQKELEMALAAVPNTLVRFQAVRLPDASADLNAKPDTFASNADSAFHRTLQARAGGAGPLQTMTDDALDSSTALFAQAHALQVLEHEFPAPVAAQLSNSNREILSGLRQRHLAAIEESLRKLKDDLKPLAGYSEVSDGRTSHGQKSAAELFEAARNLDQLVSRLLAGSYTDQAGEEMLKQLTGRMEKVETLAHAQALSSK